MNERSLLKTLTVTNYGSSGRIMWQVIEESLDSKSGEHPVRPSAPYKTEAAAQSNPLRQYDPTDKSWLVKGGDGRRIRMYVVVEDI
jgi:hypothetical protein